MERVFARVIDDGFSLRTFCDVVRSGTLGRKSFGSAPKRAIRDWFASRSPEDIFRQSIGRSPSMSDVIKMVRPPPRNDKGEADAVREALYGYLVGKNVDRSLLPFVEEDPRLEREMNLPELLRHGVLADPIAAERIAERLSQPSRAARPYALLKTLRKVAGHAPRVIVRALEKAIELAHGNVPTVAGGVCVVVDGSGSMLGPLAGARRTPLDALRCVDVASLVVDAYRAMPGDLEIAVSDYEGASMKADVVIDLQPKSLVDSDDRLYVAGFSDEVFDVVATYARGDLDRCLSIAESASI
jgi:60 kDa SS-A/Ro ribonucleoprotein